MKASTKLIGNFNPIAMAVYLGLTLLSVILYAVDVIPPSAAIACVFFAFFLALAQSASKEKKLENLKQETDKK